jgi:hypothetical protein
MDLITNGVVITPTLSSIDDKYNVNHYYQHQADFEQEGHEEYLVKTRLDHKCGLQSHYFC